MESIGVNHGHFLNHRCVGGGMAYLYRLRLVLALLLLSFSASAFAVIPVVTDTGGLRWGSGSTCGTAGDGAARCAAMNIGYGTKVVAGSPPACSVYGVGYFYQQSCTISSCPANSTLAGGSCTCNAGFQENSGSTACVPIPPDCAAGQTATATVGIGWYPYKSGSGGLVSAIQPLADAPTSICVQNGDKLCTATGSVGTLLIKSSELANGSVPVSGSFVGTLTGVTCAGPSTPGTVTAAPPTCKGTTGTVNGVTVCYPTETQAEKEARARDAASTAASLARALAASAGATEAQINAAGTAAGSAASSAVMSGASALGAASAGAAAGSSTAAAMAGGSTAAEASNAALSAGLGSAASSAAGAAAAAAGATAATQASAAAAASAAATAAATNALAAGKTAAESAAIAKAAGDAAASHVVAAALSAGGGTAGDAAAATASGAGAASAGAEAAAVRDAFDAAAPGVPDGSSEGGAGDVSRFCEDNPEAVLCKKVGDGSFSGACGSPPTCSGDAVLCAVAAATFDTECALNPSASDESALYGTSKGKTDSEIKASYSGGDVNLSSANFSQTDIFGGSPTGMADLNITVMGQSVNLPLSNVNTVLGYLGSLLLAVGFLLAFRIVSRG